MSQGSYLRCSKIFRNYKSLVVYSDLTSQLDFTKLGNVSLYTSETASLYTYFDKLGVKKGEALQKEEDLQA